MLRLFAIVFTMIITGTCLAAEPRWVATQEFKAEEAHQAAAADEKYFYAISSTVVAKYDRKSGERIAVSQGPAKHLNSGFLFEGKLYCAHSNYPTTPELSEIKVCDIATMELKTFKDFGNFGGSLTWVVRTEKHWWCNFALYGKRNGETFLVRFDPDWQEAGRWTYPPEVVRELGQYSVSGGVWLEKELVVTGHDDPVLFRLLLPPTGSVLKFVGKEPAPFTGQGIAVDPAGGLVGIRRDRKEVVFAAFKQGESK